MPSWWRRNEPQETEGQRAERERLERKRADEKAWKAANAEKVRQHSRDYKARQREKQRLREEAARNPREKRGAYDDFVRRYGTGDDIKHTPTQEQVQRWWEGPGKSTRWVGEPTPPKGQHATPPDRPRRKHNEPTVGDLIGGLFGGGGEDPEPDDTPSRGGLGIFQPPGGGNDDPPDDNGGGGGGLGIFKPIK